MGRYVGIVKDQRVAKYLIAKRVEVLQAEEEFELWKEHERALRQFWKIQSELDEGKLRLEDLPLPKHSLLDLKVKLAAKVLSSCRFCERYCKANRLGGKLGFCRAGIEWKIFGAHAHYGEEAELVPSGTIFQAACSMRCAYCCNAPESMSPELGVSWSVERVAKWMEEAKLKGMRNINWVGGDPTPWLWHILRALQACNANIAQVWNSNSYYSAETASLLEGVMDVYLLDFRYYSERCSTRLSQAPGYRKIAQRNFLKALCAGELITRLLVIPNHLECDAKPILRWLARELGTWIRLNVLQQYHPYWRAGQYAEISRPLSLAEYEEILEYAKELGFNNLVKD